MKETKKLCFYSTAFSLDKNGILYLKVTTTNIGKYDSSKYYKATGFAVKIMR